MPGVKISELPAATTPLAGTELLAIVQGGVTKQASADAVSDAVLDEFAASSGSSLVGFLQAGTGAVTRTAQSKMRDVVDVRDYGIVVDGVTSQTSALVTLMGVLSSSSYRGLINIPYGTKFDVATVYAAVPLGVILQDESSINWGQPPSYKNKFLITYSGMMLQSTLKK